MPETNNEVTLGADFVPCVNSDMCDTQFGSVALGSARTITFTIKAAVPVEINKAISIGGPNADDFRVDPGSCGIGTKLRSKTDSCTLSVTFTPTAKGVRAAELVIKFADAYPEGGSTYQQLKGSGNEV